jgi:hypothetical protein
MKNAALFISAVEINTKAAGRITALGTQRAALNVTAVMW